MTEFLTVAERNKRKKIADAEALITEFERRLAEVEDERMIVNGCIADQKRIIDEANGVIPSVVVEELNVPISFDTMNSGETYDHDYGKDVEMCECGYHPKDDTMKCDL